MLTIFLGLALGAGGSALLAGLTWWFTRNWEV